MKLAFLLTLLFSSFAFPILPSSLEGMRILDAWEDESRVIIILEKPHKKGSKSDRDWDDYDTLGSPILRASSSSTGHGG